MPIFGDQDACISEFLSHIRITVFDAQQVSFKLQVPNFKIKEAKINHKIPNSTEKNDLSKSLDP